MIEYQIILNVYLPQSGGRTIKRVISGTDRDAMATKFKYLGTLATDKSKARELQGWCLDNDIQGTIVGTDGLYGVSYIKILP